MAREREFEDFVQNVKERTDILKVVSLYVSLKKHGNNYFGCCPFHKEKTPSFSVAADKGFFYCFGCHAGGDAFKFLSLIENISYFEAIKKEAERLQIPMPERKKTKAELELDRKKEALYEVNALAAKFFHSALNTSYGEAGKEYLLSRGVDEDTINAFNFGFAPNAWDKLLAAFTARGIDEKTLLDAGLILRSEKNERLFDRFRNRVMIPITSLKGETVAFGGRAIDEAMPKYLNTADTLVFKKGDMLFNLDKAKESIRREEYAIIVEGYMDAISLFAAGITNVTASLGTAFTVNQAKLLMRYAKKLYFCYDSDEAGQRATVRALQIVAGLGAEVFIINIPDGKDPDEFIGKHGKDEFLKLVQNALPLLDFRLQYVLKRVNHNTLEGKLNVLGEVLPILSAYKDETIRHEYQKKLAKELMIDEGVIKAELKGAKYSSFAADREPIRKAQKSSDTALDKAGRAIIREAVKDSDNIEYIREILPLDLVENESQKEIFRAIFEAEEDFDISKLSEEAGAEFSRAIVEDYDEEDEEEIYIDALKTFEKLDLKIKMQQKSREIAVAMETGDDTKTLLQELKDLNDRLKNL